MYTDNSEEFQQKILKPGRKFKCKLEVDGTTIESGIKKVKYVGGSMAGKNISIGNTVSARIEVEMTTPSVLLENQKLINSILMETTSGYEAIQLGVFYPQSPKVTGEIVKFVAADIMSTKAEKMYVSELSYPVTIKAILEEICTCLEIELTTDDIPDIYINDKPEGYSYREIIGYIAGLMGKFACINRFGNLEIRWFEDNDYSVSYSLISLPTIAERDVSVNYIECSVDSETAYTSGEGLTGIQVENPFMTEDVLKDIYSKLEGFAYRPAEINMLLGDPRLDPWDIVTVKEFNIKVPCMILEYSFEGGLSGKIKAVGKSEAESESNYEGPMAKKIQRQSIELLLVNMILTQKLDADSAIIKDLTASITKTNTLIFGSATGTTIQTEFANAVIAQLGDAQILSAMIKDIAASKITSGDIITNNVRVMSEDGSLVISDETIQISDGTRVRVQIGKDASDDYSINIWDEDGNLMFSKGGITESAIKDAIIRDDMVSEKANISAHKLNIDSLFEEINGSSNTIKATQIYFDDEGQRLDVVFKTMTEDVDGLEETQQSQGTEIKTIQGQISNKIWQQDITTAIDDIEVGAVNLLNGSKDLSDPNSFFAEFNLTDGTNQLIFGGYALCM